MELKITINIASDEKDLLKTILKCSDNEFEAKLAAISRASFEETLQMVEGKKVFTRGKDFIEFRLLNFIKYYYDGIIPDEQNICDLFQTTANESRSYIRSLMSKYQYELREIINDTLKNVILQTNKENNDYYVSINSLFFKDELNKILGQIDSSLSTIEKDRGTVSNYIIKPASYKQLIKYFKIDNEINLILDSATLISNSKYCAIICSDIMIDKINEFIIDVDNNNETIVKNSQKETVELNLKSKDSVLNYLKKY